MRRLELELQKLNFVFLARLLRMYISATQENSRTAGSDYMEIPMWIS
jgi:hypothetical protein